MAATTAATTTEVESRLIAPGVFVVDDLLPDDMRKSVLTYLRAGGWKFGWKSHGKTDQFSFWHRHFAGHRNGAKEVHYDCAEELRNSSALIFGFWQLLAATLFEGKTLVRCYANGSTYGSDGTIHTDSRRDEDSSTAVYYPHDEWHPNWAGETVVFNRERTDIVAACYPRSNRLLVFKGDAPHVARGVSRICPEMRITLMFKTGMPDDRRAA